MSENKAEQVRENLKQWISLDDQVRQLKIQIKNISEQRSKFSSEILAYMKDNSVDNFTLEGNGVGELSRTVRTHRPALSRGAIRTHILYHLAEEPQRAAEILRAIEGIAEGAEDMSVGGTQRELLVRRLPRQKKTIAM